MPFKQVFETALTDTWTAAEAVDIGDKAGDIRWERTSEGMKCYKCVLYNSGDGPVAAVANMACYYFADATVGAAGDGYNGHEVTMDRTDWLAEPVAAGILQAAIANGSYGWIQIKGVATVAAACLNAAIGDGGKLTAKGAAVDGELDLAAAVTDVCVGFADDASAYIICCDFPF